MPTLMWVAFWSGMLGMALGWQETMMPFHAKTASRRVQPAVYPPSTYMTWPVQKSDAGDSK